MKLTRGLAVSLQDRSYLGKLLSAIASHQPHPPREQHLPQPPALIHTAPDGVQAILVSPAPRRKSDSGDIWEIATASP